MSRMILELQRDWIAIPLLGCLGVFNGLMYVSLWWKIDDYHIGLSQSGTTQYVADLLGFCFLIVCDQLIETSFGQIM